MTIPDQQAMWDRKFQAGEHDRYREGVSDFARFAMEQLPDESKILELGCGVGADAAAFADAGHDVISTDFSGEVILQNRTRFLRSNLAFEQMDIASEYPFEAGQFDVVFSHLALHCVAPSLMPSVMAEVHRVLKPNGLLIFDCKTTADPNFGVGEEVEPNFFVSPKGHARHLFTEDFASRMLEGAFTVITLDQGSQQTYGKQSDVLRCVAKEKRGKKLV